MLADDPHRFAAHLIEPLLLGAAEQFALGGRAFDRQAARGHEGLARHRAIGEEEHRGLRDIALGRHLAEVEFGQHPAANLLRLDRDLFGGEEGRILGRGAEQPAAIRLGRVGAITPAGRIEEIATLPQPRDECCGDWHGQQILVPGAHAVALARARQRQIADFAGHIGVVRHADGVVAREPRQQRLDPHPAPERLDGSGVDRVEALVLEDQLAAPVEQARFAAGAGETIAIDRAGRDRVELHLRPQIARHGFDHRALARFGDGVIGAIWIGDREIFLTAEIGRDVEDIARPLRLHQRHDMMHHEEIGDQIGIERVVPGIDAHVDDHVLGPRDTGIVDQIIDPPERFQRGIDRALQRVEIADIDIAERLHTAFDAGKADVLELADDPRARHRELAFAPRDDHHLGPGERQQPRDLPADSGRPAGDERDLAHVQPSDILAESGHGFARPGRLADAARHVERDLADLAFLEQDACGVARGETGILGLGIAEAYNLIAPFGLSPPSMRHVDVGFIAPDADQLLGRGAEHLCIDIALAVARIGEKHEARFLQQRIVALPVAADRAGERDVAREFHIHEARDILVAGIDQISDQLTRA